MGRRRLFASLLVLLALAACRTGRNYAQLSGPRYAGGHAAPREEAPGQPLRVVSFNIEHGRHVEAALQLISADPELRGADVLLLQEMDAAGTRAMAEALGMEYVYYPGTFSLKTQRDFGNAVLARWPIVADAKILLPHLGVLGKLQRTATAATIQVGASQVRVYSAHLGTLLNATPAAQKDQLRTILEDAKDYSHVVIGGDMNSHGAGHAARDAGYAWPTEHGPRTTTFGRWDHIFFKGLAAPERKASGTHLQARGVSDHRPVWAAGVLR